MNRPLLCVTVTAPSMAELRQARDGVTGADLIELRLDTTRDPDVTGALEGRKTPVIITCRAAWEGGEFRGSEDERKALLSDALDQGAEYVDIEWRAGFEDVLAMHGGRRVVLSSHDFDAMPDDLEDRAMAMRATGAEVIKIAGKASGLSDCVPLLARDLAGDDRHKAVLIAMGESGLPTRVLAARFGSAWTYAGSLERVGQMTAATLLDDFHFRSISRDTGVYGVVGSPVSHSMSPAMHNAAFRAEALDAVYLPLLARDTDDFLIFADAIGLRGASVTIPFKVALAQRTACVDDDVRAMGALNTLRRTERGWEGRNTDAAGFMRPLRDRGIDVRGMRASILGAGGSARAVLAGLTAAGARVTVHARDARKAAGIAMASSAAVGSWPPAAGSWDLLVNCTPIGMHPHEGESPLPASALADGLVYDLVYNPTTTRLLDEARQAGCDTINGLDMLVAQATEQFEWWTGRRPSPETMRTAAEARLSE